MHALLQIAAAAISLAAFAAAQEQPVPTERQWLSMDAWTAPTVHFETRIPAQAALTDDAPPGHQKALCVTVPDMGRDEKACAFTIDLPDLPGEYNGVRLWLKGGEKTARLEIVFLTDAGAYGREVELRPEWRQVTLGPTNTRRYFGTKQRAGGSPAGPCACLSPCAV